MNKEEVLARSRKENEVSDERSDFIRGKGANFSIGLLIFVWIAMNRFAPLDPTGKFAVGLLVNITCFFHFAYQSAKGKTKTAVFFAVAFAFASAFYAWRFFCETGFL